MTFRFVAAAVLTALASACHTGTFTTSGNEGTPLAQLDMTGPPPQKVALMGPDTVLLTQGDHLDIRVEGPTDATNDLLFTRDGKTLGIRRRANSTASGTATIHVTMPAPTELNMMGSGEIRTGALASQANVALAGSGTVTANTLTSQRLGVSIAGSGNAKLAGHADKLELNIAGTGSGLMDQLKVDNAQINIAGSGDASFASNGTVEANIMGSGNVRVKGSATCTVHALGSGKLVCQA